MPKVTNNVYKIVIVGVGGVGKSAITIQFIKSEFIEDYDPTIEDSYRKNCVIDNEVVVIDILDTAGQDEFSAMREQFMQSGDGFLLVYSITDQLSFTEIAKFHRLIIRIKDKPNYPMLLVGNKSDLLNERIITSEVGEGLAESLNIKFTEISAKNRTQVERAFQDIVLVVKKYRTQNVKKKSFFAKCEIL